jgi:hypothetical protein
VAGGAKGSYRGFHFDAVSRKARRTVSASIVDFVSVKKELMIEPDDTPFGRNTWRSKKNMMLSGPAIWNHLRNIGPSTIAVL